MNGIQFAAESGPMIDGTWYNPQTEDFFTVKDSFFQDGQLIVQATDGRMFDYNLLQNYVKTDKVPQPASKSKKQKQHELPTEILNEIEPNDPNILEDDLQLISGNYRQSKSQNVPPVQVPVTIPVEEQNVQTSTETEDQRLVKRVLDRAKKDPNIQVSIKWGNFPSKQMEMLIDYMGVGMGDVLNYYINKLDLETIRENIRQELETFIDKSLNSTSEDKDVESKLVNKPKTRNK